MALSPDEIKKELQGRGLSMSAVGRRLRPPVSPKNVAANVYQLRGQTSARVRRAIAKAIGMNEEAVFGAVARPRRRIRRPADPQVAA